MNPIREDDKIRVSSYQCPICNSIDKYIDDDIHLLTYYVPADNKEDNTEDNKLPFRFLPCISSVCKNCGFVMQFADPATPK